MQGEKNLGTGNCMCKGPVAEESRDTRTIWVVIIGKHGAKINAAVGEAGGEQRHTVRALEALVSSLF